MGSGPDDLVFQVERCSTVTRVGNARRSHYTIYVEVLQDRTRRGDEISIIPA